MAEETIAAVEPEQSTEAPELQEAVVETAPEVDYKAEYEKLEAARKAEQEQLAPMLQQWQESRRADADRLAAEELAQATQIAESIEKASEASDEPLSTEQRGRLKTLLENGVKYEQEMGNVAQERVAASAIYYAAQHLMADPVKAAVVKELMSLGGELAKYGDARLMDAHVKILSNTRSTSQTAASQAAAEARAQSGVDNAPSAVVTGGNLQDWETIGRRIADPRYGVKSLTPAEKRRYNEGRRAAGLPGVAG